MIAAVRNTKRLPTLGSYTGNTINFFPATLCIFRSFDMCTLVVRHNAIQIKSNCRNGQKLMVMFGQSKGKFDVAVVR